MMIMGTANPAMIAATSCAGVVIGAPCGASLMLVSSPVGIVSGTARRQRHLLFDQATVDYKRKVSARASVGRGCSAGVYPQFWFDSGLDLVCLSFLDGWSWGGLAVCSMRQE